MSTPEGSVFALRRQAWSGHALAIAAVVAAAALRGLLHPLLGPHLPYITFFLPVIVAAWWGGFGPALVATVMGTLTAWALFIPPTFSFRMNTAHDALGLGVFFLINLLVSGLGGAMLSSQVRSRLAEEQARQQGETLRTTLASIGDAVIATDADGRVTFVNPIAEELTGWPSAQAIGQSLESVFQIVNEDTRRPAENPVRRVLETGGIAGLANHTVLIGRHGVEHSIDDSAAPILSADGAVTGVVLVFRDVTKRRVQERTQHESADQFRRMVEGIHDCALFLLDTEGRVMTWNAGAERIKGYRADEIIGRHFSCFYPPDAITRDWPNHELRVARERGWFVDEGPRVRKDGTLFSASVIITALHDERGQLWGFSKVTRDLGERRRTAEQLRQAEERLRLAVGVAGLGTWDWDLRTGQAIWSEEHFRLMGYEPTPDGTAQVQQWSDRVHPDDRERVLQALESAKRDHAIFHPQFRLIRADDGQVVWVNVMGRFLHDERGEAVRMIGAAWNITDQKNAETELRAADRRKDEFLATLAHELRNPLAPLRNGLQLMRMAATDPHAVEQARTLMERQVEHLIRLVDDLLEVSRIAIGKIELRKARIDLMESVRTAIETSRPLIDEAGHQLTIAAPESPVWIEGDPVRLSQVIANLLNNAAKYTPPRGRIDILADIENGQARVRVRDSGRGIDQVMLPRVFEMFTQVDQDHRLTHGGLGIGLALVKSLVEMHGGSVEASSEGPGRGAEFTIRLPAASPTSHQDVAAPAALNAATSARVLVVDDNRDAATTLAALLRLMGNEVFVEHDGPAALSLLGRTRPDLVLLDLGMPGMSGFEVAARIRATPELAGLRLVALTGWGQANDRQRTKEAGFDEHLVKPVDLAALRALLSAARQ